MALSTSNALPPERYHLNLSLPTGGSINNNHRLLAADAGTSRSTSATNFMFHSLESNTDNSSRRHLPVDNLSGENYSLRRHGSTKPTLMKAGCNDHDSVDNNDTFDEEIEANPLPISSDGHIPHTDYALTETFIAKEMCKLTMEDREEVYYDIHGVNDAIDESKAGFLDQKLDEMETELRQINFEERQAYELAQCLNPVYVRDREFRLRFLRADRFNPKLAAVRYTRHYQVKLELFGPDKLGQHILQDDLGKEATDKLYCGTNQVLPKRDNAGRLVWIWITRPLEKEYAREAVLRRIFYNNMLLSEDLETQRRGSVGVIYTLKQEQRKKGQQGNNRIRDMSNMTRSLPLPIVGIHFCYDNLAWLPVLSIAQLSSQLFLQLRFRAHYGSHSECIFKLQSFGIPAETIPINENGKITSTGHKRLLDFRRLLERHSPREISKPQYSMVLVPGRSDVLLGRGKGFFNHSGNVRYRSLIEDLKNNYEKAARDQKQQLAKEVVGIVKQLGGRFLKDEGGAWIQIDDEAARMKVGHSFRALRSTACPKTKMNTATANSTTRKALHNDRNKKTSAPCRDESRNVAPMTKRMCR